MKSRSRVQRAALGALPLLLAACSSNSPDSEPQAIPPSSAPPSSAPASSETSKPSPWGRFYMEGLPLERFASLHDMVKSSNVTLLGTVVSGGPGVSFEDGSQKIELTVSVDELIGGQVNDHSSSVRVEFGPYDEGALTPALWQDLIGEKAIYVLRLQGAPIPGIKDEDPAQLKRNVYRLISPAGLLDEVSGSTDVPLTEPVFFLAQLDGQPFQDTLTAVEKAAG